MTDAWLSSVLLRHICRAAGGSDTFVGRFAKPSWVNTLATYIEAVQTTKEIKGGGREGNTLRQGAPPSLTMLMGFVDAAVSKLFLHDVMSQAPPPISILLNPLGPSFYHLQWKEP